jgi:AraC family transcriptional regulator of adaptative response/methylated-DNA-[protein]-cysteine methyltransferase
VVCRDSQAGDAFFYGVKTTGVFCRPGCRSRRPQRTNVRFFKTAAEAAAAGYRPCKRCQPELARVGSLHADQILRACRLIEAADAPPTLAVLAKAVGVSPHHFHRLFRQAMGVTPREYAAAHRLQRFQKELRSGRSVTQAIYAAGFGSNSRAYEHVSAKLGMTPGVFQRGAAGVTIRFVTRRSSLGWVLVAATGKGVCAIELGDDPTALRRHLEGLFPRARLVEDGATLAAWVDEILACVSAPQRGLDLPLDIQGTAFQRRVWQALQRLRVGQTASYSGLASAIGAPQAVRAVARACAANKIALAVPCHRAVRADGSLGGYRWGLARKRALLQAERQARAAGP